MTRVETKQYKCYECDKPYIKKGAPTNHMRKVHSISKSPVKKEFMDISNNSESDINDTINKEDDELELDKTCLLEHAKDLDRKEESEELEVILGMKSTLSFDDSVLTQANVAEDPPKLVTILTNSDNGVVGEPFNAVPLCSPAARFMSESQKKILIPDIQESDNEESEVQEETPLIVNCDNCNEIFSNQEDSISPMESVHVKSVPDKFKCNECAETFSNRQDCMKHMRSVHTKNNHNAGDHKCEECSYRTNIAANYLTHFFKSHTTDQFVNKINS